MQRSESNLKKGKKNILLIGIGLVGMYIAGQSIAKKHAEDKKIDDDNEYLDLDIERNTYCETHGLYERTIKPVADKILSFIGLVVLSLLMGVLAVAVWVDDPGPVFFTQKRVGKDGEFFMLHKYRTMRMSTPHDVPTHELCDPEQYITRVGRFLRRSSLDELPQIWDIFRGKMSVIGPRPALWNQKDLIEERSKYGANSVLPGLTGLAQIKGRDELLIPDKAKLDGEYTSILRAGGGKALFQDAKLFCLTVASVIKHDGVVEGGTGSLLNPSDDWQTKRTTGVSAQNADDAGFDEYGYKKIFRINKNDKKKVLITGAGSYIGESFITYCKKNYPNIECTAIDMVDGSWRNYDFSPYDAVFHVAGIAHADVGRASEEMKAKYYAVNTDLAVETARKAKEDGVGQFLFMSSMIIYGDSAPYGKEKIITETTIPSPTNFYGDSKWRADVGVRKLGCSTFHVAVLRPPLIYGRGAKGNYSILAKLARKLPIFPDIDNCRSMLYIENLCEFLSLLILGGEGGIYFPQNSSYIKTSTLVREIGITTNCPVYTSKLLNPAIFFISHISDKTSSLVNKAFGNQVYDQRLSQYDGIDYQLYDLRESIIATESDSSSMSVMV